MRYGLRRKEAVAILTGAALLYFAMLLWSTCNVGGCGSVHSSIWLRVGVLAIPFALVAYSGWKVTHSPETSATTLVIGLPWLVVATLLSGWELSLAPSSSPDSYGGAVTETAAAPFSIIVPSILLAIAWIVVLNAIGWSSLKAGFRSALRSHLRKFVMIIAIAVSTGLAAGISASASAGSGVDIIPGAKTNTNTSNGLSTDQQAQAPSSPGPTFVQIKACKDETLVQCKLVANNVLEGASFDLAPGIYTIASYPPSGYSCSSTTPTIMYLFPFERLHVQFLNVSCYLTPAPTPTPSPYPY